MTFSPLCIVFCYHIVYEVSLCDLDRPCTWSSCFSVISAEIASMHHHIQQRLSNFYSKCLESNPGLHAWQVSTLPLSYSQALDFLKLPQLSTWSHYCLRFSKPLMAQANYRTCEPFFSGLALLVGKLEVFCVIMIHFTSCKQDSFPNSFAARY